MQPLETAQAPTKSVRFAEDFQPAERRLLDDGIKQHRETTESARRSLKLVEHTTEFAQSTLVEVHRQGHQLEKTDQGLETLESDVREASKILRFMRRWCCFQILCCCDCFDPEAASDKARPKRLQQRQLDQQFNAMNSELEYTAKAEAVGRLTQKKSDPAFNNDVDAARSELFGKYRPAKEETESMRIGAALPQADRSVIQQESLVQDEMLDRIADGVQGLKLMSEVLHEELNTQAGIVDTLGDKMEAAHQNLGTLSKHARRV